jgi:arylamine N-acetyltransferase
VALQQYTLTSLPFENLSLHYSRTPAIDLHPTSLFEKIVANPAAGRGGYCMELNTLFATVLRTLGFSVMSTGGRLSSQASPNGCSSTGNDQNFYYGFAHMVNIVTIYGRRYLVDVGFGAGGPVCPVLLEDGSILEEVGPARRALRVRWDVVPDGEDPEAKVWHLEQKRTGADSSWTGLYCFPDRMEFSPADFEVMSCFASSSRKSFYVNVIVVVKFLFGGSLEGIVGEMVETCLAYRYGLPRGCFFHAVKLAALS